MCVESMDTCTKRTKNCFVRRSIKPGSKLRWKLPRVSTKQQQQDDDNEAADKALKLRTTIQKGLRRAQKRAHLDALAEVFGVMSERRSQPAGAMAPRNTTQYLMGKVYEDMNDNRTAPVSRETNGHLYAECLSPVSVYAALDDGYESCLAFQERDFDEAFDQC